MTAPMPGHQQGPGAAAAPPAAPVTLVLSRAVKAGHEQAFEDVLHRLAAEVRRQPGHLDLTVLAPQPGGPCLYTIVSHFADRAAADAWLASQDRAQLVAEADLHAAGDLQTRYLSGLEGWLAQPGAAVLVPPARWKVAFLSAVGIVPLLEAVTYLLAPRLLGLPVWARPLISVVLVIPLMQYAMMPLLTRAARPFLYPPRPAQPTGSPP
jgi:antibiotic biosynthesis monooxygenase (ABM) superfamily enzyme